MADDQTVAPQIADPIGLHVNSARHHLRRMVADGLAGRVVTASRQPGRPPCIAMLVRPYEGVGFDAAEAQERAGDLHRARRAPSMWG